MTHVIAEPCIGTCDTSCVEVCPSNSIHGPNDPEGAGAEVADLDSKEGKQLFINPDECIDCGVCATECPVEAIYPEDELPEKWESFKDKNAAFFGE